MVIEILSFPIKHGVPSFFVGLPEGNLWFHMVFPCFFDGFYQRLSRLHPLIPPAFTQATQDSWPTKWLPIVICVWFCFHPSNWRDIYIYSIYLLIYLFVYLFIYIQYICFLDTHIYINIYIYVYLGFE